MPNRHPGATVSKVVQTMLLAKETLDLCSHILERSGSYEAHKEAFKTMEFIETELIELRWALHMAAKSHDCLCQP